MCNYHCKGSNHNKLLPENIYENDKHKLLELKFKINPDISADTFIEEECGTVQHQHPVMLQEVDRLCQPINSLHSK